VCGAHVDVVYDQAPLRYICQSTTNSAGSLWWCLSLQGFGIGMLEGRRMWSQTVCHVCNVFCNVKLYYIVLFLVSGIVSVVFSRHHVKFMILVLCLTRLVFLSLNV